MRNDQRYDLGSAGSVFDTYVVVGFFDAWEGKPWEEICDRQQASDYEQGRHMAAYFKGTDMADTLYQCFKLRTRADFIDRCGMIAHREGVFAP